MRQMTDRLCGRRMRFKDAGNGAFTRTSRAQPGNQKYAGKENENPNSPADNLSPVCLVHRFAHFYPTPSPNACRPPLLMTPVEPEDKDFLLFRTMQSSLQTITKEAEVQDAWIERVRGNKSKIEKSSRQLSVSCLTKWSRICRVPPRRPYDASCQQQTNCLRKRAHTKSGLPKCPLQGHLRMSHRR